MPIDLASQTGETAEPPRRTTDSQLKCSGGGSHFCPVTAVSVRKGDLHHRKWFSVGVGVCAGGGVLLLTFI